MNFDLEISVAECIFMVTAKTLRPASISSAYGGGAIVQGKLPVPSVLLLWLIVWQGPTAPAVGAGGGCLDIFLSSLISLFVPPLSLGDGPI